MLRIGLTGGIGSGKTTVSDYFNSLFNVPIIDADSISHALTSPEGAAFQQVINLFGEHIIKNGELNRKKIRDEIFKTPSLRKALEDIIHPKVQQSIIEMSEQLTEQYCLVVIPLLIEANMQSIVDRILVVHSDPALQVSRVTNRDQCTAADVEKIIESQLAAELKLKYADDVITNNDSHESLIPQIERLHKKYLDLSK